jgi:phosphohistidine phosphatase
MGGMSARVDRRLLLLRHAKSDWPTGVPDRDRPLGDRGRVEAPAAGRWLAATGLTPDLAVVSSARRAQQTWGLASSQLPADIPTTLSDDYYGAGVDEALDLVRGLPDDVATVLLVGHNPTTESLALLLQDGTGVAADVERMAGKYPTSAIAVLHLQVESWADLGESTARLLAFAVPR